MKVYLEALEYIMENGVDREDRTGTGTRSVFTQQLRFNLQEGFPAVTTKRLPFKSVLSELLWFIEGSSDERRLAEILYGKDRSELEDKTTIWTANANADYWKGGRFEGDLGRVYGVQWRDWRSPSTYTEGLDGDFTEITNKTDQLADVIQRIKDKPWDRRHLIIAYNPGEIEQMCLPPCHYSFQFYVAENKLSCHMNMRSADFPLGVPFNIASYALLTHMVAQVTNLDVGELIITTGDSHIYHNQFDGVKEQLKRAPTTLPTLEMNTKIKNIDEFTMDDFKLLNYNPQGKINYPFSV